MMGSGPADDCLTPTVVAGLGPGVGLCVAASAAYAIDGQGRVRSWGWDGFQHLLGRGVVQYPPPLLPSSLRALGHVATERMDGDGGAGTPDVVDGLSDIVHVTASEGNVYALAGSGEVWAWGSSRGLGRRRKADADRPRRIDGLSGITAVSASPDGMCCYALDGNGRVWSWGNGFEGELGHGKLERSAEPRVIEALEGVSSIHANDFAAWALLRDGSVYFWGNGQEVGITRRGSYRIKTPLRVDAVSPALELVAGRRCCLARLRNGQMLGIGASAREMLGERPGQGVFEAAALQSMTAVSLSKQHGLAWDAQGVLHAFGRSEAGALGLGTAAQEVTEPTRVPGVGPVHSAFAGATTSFAIVRADTDNE